MLLSLTCRLVHFHWQMHGLLFTWTLFSILCFPSHALFVVFPRSGMASPRSQDHTQRQHKRRINPNKHLHWWKQVGKGCRSRHSHNTAEKHNRKTNVQNGHHVHQQPGGSIGNPKGAGIHTNDSNKRRRKSSNCA